MINFNKKLYLIIIIIIQYISKIHNNLFYFLKNKIKSMLDPKIQ